MALGPGSVVTDTRPFLLSQGSLNVTCNITDQVPLWRVNDVTFTVNQLNDGLLPDHTQIIAANKSTLIASSPVNSTKYACLVTQAEKDILSISFIIHIAGKYVYYMHVSVFLCASNQKVMIICNKQLFWYFLIDKNN